MFESRNRRINREKNAITQPLSQIPGYATGWKSIPDPRCGAKEASVAETRGRLLDHERRNVGRPKLAKWQRRVVETSC